MAPSQRELPARAEPFEGAIFTEAAVATEVATTSPVLSIVSLPAPASIPTARASASDVETAADIPSKDAEIASAGAVATEVATTAPSLVMVSSPVAAVEESAASIHTSPSATTISPDIDKSLPSPSPLIPIASDVAVVPPFQSELPVNANPLETATFIAAAVETAVAAISPVLVTLSLPAPASIPTAFALAVAAERAAPVPSTDMATPRDGTVDTAVATTSPSLVIVSSPLTIVEERSALSITASSVISIIPDAWKSLPSPSPFIPTASAVASVPPSQIVSATNAPFFERETTTAPAVDTAVETSSPVFSIVSFPAPPSIAAASALAFAVETAVAFPSRLMATSTTGEVATAVAVIRPLLVIVSSPPAFT